jgi:hypothetical protein
MRTDERLLRLQAEVLTLLEGTAAQPEPGDRSGETALARDRRSAGLQGSGAFADGRTAPQHPLPGAHDATGSPEQLASAG